MSMRSYFMAKFYDATMQKMEDACLKSWRSELLSGICGDILEIGSGTGANLRHYREAAGRIVLAEPDMHMRNLLKQKIETHAMTGVAAEDSPAEKLNFPDNSFDAVVSTLVLCSVNSVEAALKEIRRVLKSGGKFYFIEHVLAKDSPHLIKWQKLVQPLWICVCGNCHTTRDTERHIADAGFDFDTLDRRRSSGAPSIVSPTIVGVASH
jgi:ubiquinone/menaquinone biosynthesis C-methylase UbiE